MHLYTLSLFEAGRGIQIGLSEDAQVFLERCYNTSFWPADYLTTFNLDPSELVPFGQNRFGYRETLGLEKDGVRITAAFPQEGSYIYLIGSLFTLFKCLSTVGPADGKKYEQIMEVELELKHRSGGHEVSAECSDQLHRWLSATYWYGRTVPLPFATEAMLTAGRTLGLSKGGIWEYRVNAEIRQRGGLRLQCDSDDCNMGPGDEIRDGERFLLSTHNSHRSRQQLMFLAGLAAISEQYTISTEGKS